MVNKGLVNAEQLSQAFDDLVSESSKALQLGWEETAASAKLVASAAEREQETARLAMESLANLSRAQAETLEALFRIAPTGQIGKATEETREVLEKLSGQSHDAYRTWSGYLVDLQKRQASLVNDLVRANIKALEPNQLVAESMVKHGEALLGWSEATAKALSPK